VSEYWKECKALTLTSATSNEPSQCIFGTAHITCGAGFMKRYDVHSSVRLFHSPAAAACGGFAAVGPAGRRY